MTDTAARSLHCPACGAPAELNAARCDYCRARLATVSCPSCFGLLFDGSGFCQHCGAARQRTELPTDGSPPRCPACTGTMKWIRVGDADLLECEQCDGTWVEAATFERLCAEREAQAAIMHRGEDTLSASAKASARLAQPTRVRYRPCPRCARLMNRVNFGRSSGAVVDVCKGHGTFMDRGELHQIVRFIQGGGMERMREAQRAELVEEQRKLQDLLHALSRTDPR